MKSRIIPAALMLACAVALRADEISTLQSKITANYLSATVTADLIALNHLYIKEDREKDALEFYRVVAGANKGKILEAVAICLSAPMLLRQEKFDEVKTSCVYIKENFKGTHWAAEALYNLGELYLNVYEDKATSDNYFRELVRDCPKSGLVGSAKIYLGEI